MINIYDILLLFGRQNENIFKNHQFYLTTYGVCFVNRFDFEENLIKVVTKDKIVITLDKFGRLHENGECILFPTNTERDWQKFLTTNLTFNLSFYEIKLIAEYFVDYTKDFHKLLSQNKNKLSNEYTYEFDFEKFVTPYILKSFLEEKNVSLL
jgi:hypothetical protein